MSVPSQVSQVATVDRDLTFLAAAKSTSQDAFLAIFDLHAPALYNYAFFLCDSALIADQIVGEVFARLSEDLLAGRGPRINLRFYLYGIAYRLLADETYFSDRPPVDMLRWKDIRRGNNRLNAEDRPYVETVQRALRDDLKNDQRHVVVLRFMAGFSVKETAAIMGKTVTNVKVIQNRAMAALREALGDPVVETRAISLLLARMSGA
ncbi:MAG: RNA polymerase sigma factor [Bacteroidota bacterium]